MPVSTSQVAARVNRLIGPYRARSRSRASKLLARPPRSRNSVRMALNTHLVIVTGSALGTTRVMIADSTVATTISAPTPNASTASTVVSTASLPPLSADEVAAGYSPAGRPRWRPAYSPRWRAAARTLAASLARPLGTQTRFPPVPASCTSRSSSRPHHSGRRGSGSLLEGMPASASTARTLEANSGVRKFPSRRLAIPGGRLPDPSSISGSSHPAPWVGVQGCLQCSAPRQPAWEIGRHRLVWSMAPAC
jgi:hypothetical protein